MKDMGSAKKAALADLSAMMKEIDPDSVFSFIMTGPAPDEDGKLVYGLSMSWVTEADGTTPKEVSVKCKSKKETKEQTNYVG